jgi:hypothetical protein
MGGPARLAVLLAFAAAAQVAAATDRFVPANPQFVVGDVRRSVPDDELRQRVEAWRRAPGGEAATALASAYFERARTLREPAFVGRAEAVLAPLVAKHIASDAQRRLYAEALQYRHAFGVAGTLLDEVLAANPRDAEARTQRAALRLVRGDFGGARSDCAALAARGDRFSTAGIACLAQALAGSGEFARARALLDAYPSNAVQAGASRAYLLAVRAELRERAQDLDGAIADYGAALAEAPRDDATRAALTDALWARGEAVDARALLEVERPSLALLTRLALYAASDERAGARAFAAAQLALESGRGDVVHGREAALLALDAGDARRALDAAQANFTLQRELADVRVLARAAVAARDTKAQRQLREWLESTGYHDAITENILDGAG